MENVRSLEAEITTVTTQHLQRYPHTTLQDLYKSFFQDEFGPGHLLEDLEQARAHLLTELTSLSPDETGEVELCGLGRHFCRLPLSLILSGQVEQEAYFHAFASSAIAVTRTDIEAWYAKWETLEEMLRPFSQQIQNFTHDAKSLRTLFAMGEYQVSHSEMYRQHYHPHYRIFSLSRAKSLTADLSQFDISILN